MKELELLKQLIYPIKLHPDSITYHKNNNKIFYKENLFI